MPTAVRPRQAEFKLERLDELKLGQRIAYNLSLLDRRLEELKTRGTQEEETIKSINRISILIHFDVELIASAIPESKSEIYNITAYANRLIDEAAAEARVNTTVLPSLKNAKRDDEGKNIFDRVSEWVNGTHSDEVLERKIINEVKGFVSSFNQYTRFSNEFEIEEHIREYHDALLDLRQCSTNMRIELRGVRDAHMNLNEEDAQLGIPSPAVLDDASLRTAFRTGEKQAQQPGPRGHKQPEAADPHDG